MPLRNFETDDFSKIKAIHEKYYGNEFPFPNLSDFLSFCVGVDESGEIIALGGVRNIPELIFITDKSQPTIKRIKCLKEMLTFCTYIAHSTGRKQVYALVEGAEWIRNLKEAGFRQFKAVPLVFDLE